VLTVLDVSYFLGEPVGATSARESWIVLFDGTSHEIVGRLTVLFDESADTVIALERRELLEGGADPVVLLEGVVRDETDEPCLTRRVERRKLVLCDRLAGGYRCTVETMGGTETIEASGVVHPLSSQYNGQVAAQCAPVLERAQLTPDTWRRETSIPTRTLTVVDPGRFWITPPTEQIILAERIATATCTTAF
jgi:hypothetical protein